MEIHFFNEKAPYRHVHYTVHVHIGVYTTQLIKNHSLSLAVLFLYHFLGFGFFGFTVLNGYTIYIYEVMRCKKIVLLI